MDGRRYIRACYAAETEARTEIRRGGGQQDKCRDTGRAGLVDAPAHQLATQATLSISNNDRAQQARNTIALYGRRTDDYAVSTFGDGK